MVDENPLIKRNDVDKRKCTAMLIDVLNKSFRKWEAVFQTHETSKFQMAVYLKLLKDLPPSLLEQACEEVMKTALNFPKPAEVLATARKLQENNDYLGPKMIDYPKVSDEERSSGAEITAEFKKRMGWDNQPKAAAPRKLQVMHPSKSWEEQKAELVKRGYLTTNPHDPKCLCPQCRARRERESNA